MLTQTLKREILDEMRVLGPVKLADLVANLGRPDYEIQLALVEMVKIGCVRFDGSRYWRAEL